MGVISRRVLPACGNLCFFCPSLRPRSRHPLKRYKHMLAEIFPRNQDAEPDDRKIGKLCEYASRNPLRIPKITEYLEQKCYKELRNGNTGSVKVVLCIYKKMLSSCKEQMPLFSCSLLSIVRTLLEQTKEEEVQILGCNTLVDFISLQTENSHMFNLEGIIPKLCQLAQEMGDDERSLRLRPAGMQALAFMVSFIGEHSQLSMDLDMIMCVILENYMDLEKKGQEDTNEAGENSETKIPKMSKWVSFKRNPVNEENMDLSKSPSYWSMACLCNIAKLAKETTTLRRVLEPLMNAFDCGSYWSPEKGRSNYMALVRCFQLAFSLRNLSLNQDGGMQLSRRRSIFTFASYLLIFSAKISNVPELIPLVKESLNSQMVDPCLVLEGDIRLLAVSSGFPQKDDDSASLNSSAVVVSNDGFLKEIVITQFTSNFQTLSEEEQSNLRKGIESDFSRDDDAHPLGAPFFMDTPGSSSPIDQTEVAAFDEVELSAIVAFEGTSPGASGSEPGHNKSLSSNTNLADVLSVNQLLESVSETAREVASLPVSSIPVPYDQMMNQCEALVTGKQQKMSVLQSFKPEATKAITLSEEDELFLLDDETEEEADEDDQKVLNVVQVQQPQAGQLGFCSLEVEQNSFRLPSSSPYDEFLKAAGC
ncbi:ARM repeat superfamily protein [Raphanus sativus]|nr:ARM repeat superfamily protein [Raphanus sativus]KAJ4914536.1 ARM repeat superfamily protein [Raphanus sativus]